MTATLRGKFTISVAAALLAGCGGSQPPISAPGAITQSRTIAAHVGRGGSWMLPEAMSYSHEPWLYVVDLTGDAVYIYALNGSHATQIGEITNGLSSPFGATVDNAGNLYVVNRVAQGSVAIYPPGQTTPSLSLSGDLAFPDSVAVDNGGDVWVTNRGTSSEKPGIAVFPSGKTTPSVYITSNLIRYPLEDFFDQQGNAYFCDADTGVSKIPSGTKRPVSLHLQGLRYHNSCAAATLALSSHLYVDNYDPNRNEVYTGIVYLLGNGRPIYHLKGHVAGYYMANGQVKSQTYIFVPDWYSGNVYLYKDGSKQSFAEIDTRIKNGRRRGV